MTGGRNRGWRRGGPLKLVAGVVAVLVGVAVLIAPTANAAFRANTSSTFPDTVVGQTFPASYDIFNSSTPPDSTTAPSVRFAAIDLYPACTVQTTDCQFGTAEAGVFDVAPGPAPNGVGIGQSVPPGNPSCEGTWDIVPDNPDPNLATRWRFVPPGGEGSLILFTGDSCTVNFTATTLRVPTTDTQPAPGFQTNQATGHTTFLRPPNSPACLPFSIPCVGEGTANGRQGLPLDATVAAALPGLSTQASVGLPSGAPGSLGTTSDTAFLTSPPPPSSILGVPPMGTITFQLYGPFPAAPGVADCVPGTVAPDGTRGPVAVNGFRDPPVGYDTPTPVDILAPGFYTWVATYSGDANYTGSTTACNDGAEIVQFLPLPTITVDKTADPLVLPEPGGAFTFNVVVTNTSPEAVTITSLTDDVYGDLDDPANPAVTANSCVGAVGTVLAAANPGTTDTFTCSFTGQFTGSGGDAQTDTVTAFAVDADGNTATDSDDAVVTLLDVLPTIVVDKTADPLSLPEPGGNFTFTVVITNTSPEPVTVQTLVDNIYGDLNDPANVLVTNNTCLAAIPALLAESNPGTTDTVTCSFDGEFLGGPGAEQTDIVTATAIDDDGNTATDDDDAVVTITDVIPTITVDKTANPLTRPEPGGAFTFTVVITNTSPEAVTIRTLVDDVYGDLDDPANPAVTANTCLAAVPTVLAPANPGTTDTFTCSFTGQFAGSGGDAQTDVVTATADDDDGNTATDSDDAVVSLTDVIPTIALVKTADPLNLPEPGGAFTFTVVITNNSPEPVTIRTIVDDVYGNLDDAANPAVTNNTCLAAVDTVLPAANPTTSDTFTCSFTGQFTGVPGDAQTDTVTATADDDDGNTATADDDAIVTIGGVPPEITVDKTANPLTLPEPGGAFTFTVVVTNTSTLEAVTITSLLDDIYGDLDDPANTLVTNNTCLDAVGTMLATANAGTTDTFTCSFTGQFTGDAPSAQTDIVTVEAIDDDGQPATDSDDAIVTLTDALPSIVVDKTANPLSLPEPGGDFTFTVVVTNTSAEQVTVQTLVDDVYGNLDDPANPAVSANGCLNVVGTILAAANAGTTDTVTCTFVGEFTGVGGDFETDTVTATATDDEGNIATDDDPATVSIGDVAPVITVDKTANPLTLPEPGGAFTFTVVITNTSTVEEVTITDLVDDIYGDLDDAANPLVTNNTCVDAVGTVLATANAGTTDTFTCSFTGQFTGNALDEQTDVVTATGVDDDGQTATDSDDAIVTLTDVLPVITVDKTANPVTRPSPGGTYTFTVVVTNNSAEPVTIQTLVDDVYGNLDDAANPAVTSNGCLDVVGTVLAAANAGTTDTVTCTFVGEFTGVGGDSETDTVTATATDDDDNTATDDDDATVTITSDVPTILVDKTATPPSRPEPGGAFTFTVVVTNVSTVPLTITSLNDNVYPNLTTRGTCTNAIGFVLPANGGTYSCTFTADFNGAAGASQTDTITAVAEDDQGNEATDSDDATVTITGVPPTVTIVKTASPTTLPEPGGQFTFTFVVTNTSTSETVTITSLTDDIYGNLAGRGNCAVGAVLAPGATYTCAFTVPFTGVPGATQTDVASVTVVDDDGEQATDTDDAIITITDIPPVITVQKTATPLTRNEPGGTFTFDVVITNTSAEVVTITDLTDNIYGNLNGRGTCAVGAVLAANGGVYRCSFPGDFFGNAGASQTDIVTASAVDNDGSRTTARDDAIVRIVDVPPTVTVVKDADPVSRPEPGGSFTFIVTITNTSIEPVTVVSITDDVYGNLVGRGTCAAGAVIQPGGSYRCQFTVDFRGAGGATQVDRVFIVVVDNDGSRANANDDARISLTPVGSPIVVQPVAPQPTPAAQQLGRTGADVSGPARLALALLVAGLLMLGATWRSNRLGLALAPGSGPGSTTSRFTRSPSPGGGRRFLGGGGSGGRTAAPPRAPSAEVIEAPTRPDDPPVDGPSDDFADFDDDIDDDIDPDDPDPDDTDPGGSGGGGSPPSGWSPSSGGGSGAATPAPAPPAASAAPVGGADAARWEPAPRVSGPDAGPADAAGSIADRADGIAPAPLRPATAALAAPAMAALPEPAATTLVGPGPAPTATRAVAAVGDRSLSGNARRVVAITRLVTVAAVVAGVSHAVRSGRGSRRSAGRLPM